MKIDLSPKSVVFLALASISLTPNAIGQSVDYGSLEMLFGEPVTTSATGKPQRAAEAPASLIIISQDDLRRSGASNLAEVLRNYAGVDVAQTGGNFYDVSVRGAPEPFNPRLLVLVNGRQVYLDHYGFTSWETIGVEFENIRQVEVVKGPGSALFGFNAALATINIVTFNPQYDDHNQLTVSAGPDGVFQATGAAGVKLGNRGGVRLSAGHVRENELDDLRLPAPFALPVKDAQRTSVMADGQVQTSASTQLRLSGSYSESTSFSRVPSPADAQHEIETYALHGQFVWDGSLGLFKVTSYYNNLSQDITVQGAEATPLGFKSDLFVVQLEDLVRLGSRDTLRFGAEYRKNQSQAEPSLTGTTDYDLFAGSTMWEHLWSDQITSSISGRVDHIELGRSGDLVPFFPFPDAAFDRSLTSFSVNAGLTFKATPLETWRLLFGRGLQAPSLLSFSFAVPLDAAPGQTTLLVGDPQADPSVTYSAELGYSRHIPDWDMKLSVNAFFTDVNGIITFPGNEFTPTPLVPGLLIGEIRDRGGYQSYGAEASLEGSIGDAWTWGLNYTFNEADEDFPVNDPVELVPTGYEGLLPTHKLNGHLGYAHGRWEADVFARLRSGTRDELPLLPALNPSNGGTSLGLDARVAFRLLDRIWLEAKGQNITDSGSTSLTTRRAEARFSFGLKASF